MTTEAHPPRRRASAPRLAAPRLAGALLAALLPACAAPDWLDPDPADRTPVERGPPSLAVMPAGAGSGAGDGAPPRGAVFTGAPTHGQLARERGEALDAVIRRLLLATRPAVMAVQDGLARAVQRLAPPERLATSEPGLREWRDADRRAYRTKVDALYDVARAQLQKLHDLALATATARAYELAPPRSTLDEGPTGDRQLDQRLTALAEVMDGAAGLDDIDSAREQDKQRDVELVQVFSSFGSQGAEEALDGRLLLFIGGDESEGLPRCVVVYRHDGPGEPGAHSIGQVVRHRVMRGDAIVHDLPWRPMPSVSGDRPGFPRRELFGEYLVAPDVEPVMNRAAPSYDQLRDNRVVVDMQSAVIDPGGRVLGGVDWRIQFNVSTRGDLTWDVSGGRPVYDAWCTEVRNVLGAAPAVAAR